MVYTVGENLDVTYRDEGSIVAIQPLSKAAKEWFAENVQSEGWQWLGNTLGVDHGCADAVLYGAQEAGLIVVQESIRVYMSNEEKFAQEYAEQLKTAVEEDASKPADKQQFAWHDPAEIPVIVGKMVPALKTGGAITDSIAIKRTCKALGIKSTISAIKEYLSA